MHTSTAVCDQATFAQYRVVGLMLCHTQVKHAKSAHIWRHFLRFGSLTAAELLQSTRKSKSNTRKQAAAKCAQTEERDYSEHKTCFRLLHVAVHVAHLMQQLIPAYILRW
jgi:hypothetical protein